MPALWGLGAGSAEGSRARRPCARGPAGTGTAGCGNPRLLALERFDKAWILLALAYAVWAFRGQQISLREELSSLLPLFSTIAERFGVHLLYSKRLFGVRGGRAAHEAQRHATSLLEVEQTAVSGPRIRR